jgi:hypothetical protein
MKWARVAELEMELDGKKIVKYRTTQKFTSTLKNSDVDCAQRADNRLPKVDISFGRPTAPRTRLSQATVTRLGHVDRLTPSEHTVIRSVAQFLCRQKEASHRTVTSRIFGERNSSDAQPSPLI